MDEGNPLAGVIFLLAFMVLDAIFYGFGAAIQSINGNKLEKEKDEGSKKAGKLLRILDSPAEFIYTNQVATNMIGITTGAFVLGRLEKKLEILIFGKDIPVASWLSFVNYLAAAVILLILLITFGIVIPKKCAARKPEKWAYATLPFVTVLSIPLIPFTWAVTGLSYAVLKMMGIDMKADEDNVTEEEIMLMVNEGHEQGVLEASEAEMITNIFELDSKDAGDIMTHRTNVVAIDSQLTLKEAVSFILREANNSRFPVYEKDIDDIIGILHMRDALVYAEDKESLHIPIKEISGLLREPHFIPETRNIDTLFKEMQSQKIHMEIVVDEYGQTAGIVTMEDILEEIVGNILDEYDEDEEFISRRDDGSYLLDGMTPLEDVSKALDLEFEEEEYDTYDTINGFLISKLDRIPQEDEILEISYQGLLFKVLSVENKMIHTVIVTREPEETVTAGE